MRSCFAAAVLLLASVAAQDTSSILSGHDSHDEGEHFQAAAVYVVEAGTSSLVAMPVDRSFEVSTLAFMIVPAASADMDGLEGAEEDAEIGAFAHFFHYFFENKQQLQESFFVSLAVAMDLLTCRHQSYVAHYHDRTETTSTKYAARRLSVTCLGISPVTTEHVRS